MQHCPYLLVLWGYKYLQYTIGSSAKDNHPFSSQPSCELKLSESKVKTKNFKGLFCDRASVLSREHGTLPEANNILRVGQKQHHRGKLEIFCLVSGDLENWDIFKDMNINKNTYFVAPQGPDPKSLLCVLTLRSHMTVHYWIYQRTAVAYAGVQHRNTRNSKHLKSM